MAETEPKTPSGMYLLRSNSSRNPSALFRGERVSREQGNLFLEVLRARTGLGTSLTIAWADEVDAATRIRLNREVSDTKDAAAPNFIDRNNNRPLQKLLEDSHSILEQARAEFPLQLAESSSEAHRTQSPNLVQWAGAGRCSLAIVFTDIVGSSALGRELGDDRMNKSKQQHFAQSCRLSEKHDGRVVKTMGDGVLAVFRTAKAAFEFAVAVSANPGIDGVRIRAGIHSGEVEIQTDDVLGQTVDLAARIAGFQKAPEIWVSSHVQHELRKRGGEYGAMHWVEEMVELAGFGTRQVYRRNDQHTEGPPGWRSPSS